MDAVEWLEILLESTDVPPCSPDYIWVASVSKDGRMLINTNTLHEGYAAPAEQWVWLSDSGVMKAIRERRQRSKSGLHRYVERLMRLPVGKRFAALTRPMH